MNVSKEDEVQAEGCPVETITFPLPVTQTEISLDIGSPSFRYVDDIEKVRMIILICKARYVNEAENLLSRSRRISDIQPYRKACLG